MTRFLKLHHIQFWARGGSTNALNLVTVCHFHHKLIHTYGWSVSMTQAERAIWFRPSGRRYEPGGRAPDRAPPAEKRRLRLVEGIGFGFR